MNESVHTKALAVFTANAHRVSVSVCPHGCRFSLQPFVVQSCTLARAAEALSSAESSATRTAVLSAVDWEAVGAAVTPQPGSSQEANAQQRHFKELLHLWQLTKKLRAAKLRRRILQKKLEFFNALRQIVARESALLECVQSSSSAMRGPRCWGNLTVHQPATTSSPASSFAEVGALVKRIEALGMLEAPE